ncbi:MAG: restriction endonuclease subunit S [bacterium]
MHKNENRPGYKNSKVGWIPEEWYSFPLKTLTSRIGDGIHTTPDYVEKSDYYFINGNNLVDGRVSISEQTKCVSKEEFVKHHRELGFRTLLLSINGTIGSVAYFNEENVILGKSAAYINCGDHLDKTFAFNFLNSQKTNSFFRGELTGSTIQNLSLASIRLLPVSLPPLPEQKAIARVLECWDRGIVNLELKIVNKRNIKNGLMQQLLSGKLRLPGFGAELGMGNGELRILNSESRIPEGWESVELGEVFDFVSTYAFSRECLTTEAIDNSDIYNIHYGDIHATYTGPILDLAKERRVPMLKTSDALPDKLEFLQEGDLVMADVSEDYEGIGACIELKNLANKKLTGGLHTFVMRDTSSQTAEGFRGYMFNEYRLAKELKRIATGVSVYSLSKTNLAKIELLLPPLAEQQSITSVLWGADEEIAALEKKLALWKEQKKYLLNNLVTGTIRLPEFEL